MSNRDLQGAHEMDEHLNSQLAAVQVSDIPHINMTEIHQRFVDASRYDMFTRKAEQEIVT